MKITDTHIYFWNGIYSNWYNCKIEDPRTNLIFANTEQAFMWYKADQFKDNETKALIENATNPKDAKKLGRSVKNYNEQDWCLFRFGYMGYVNSLKFGQHDELRNELLSTGDKILVEASPYDIIWGVGLSENDPLILDSKNWKGLNLLGESLMKVRNYLRNKSK